MKKSIAVALLILILTFSVGVKCFAIDIEDPIHSIIKPINLRQ